MNDSIKDILLAVSGGCAAILVNNYLGWHACLWLSGVFFGAICICVLMYADTIMIKTKWHEINIHLNEGGVADGNTKNLEV